MKKNDWVEKYNKYADENFDFNKLVDAYQIMSDEYYDLAVYFYMTWEDKTTEEVLFPSSEEGFLQKASYNNYKRLVDDIYKRLVDDTGYNGKITYNLLEYMHCFDIENDCFEFDPIDPTLLYYDDIVKQSFYLAMHLERLSWLHSSFKISFTRFIKRNQESSDQYYEFPYLGFEKYKDWVLSTAHFTMGKLRELEKRSMSAKPGGIATKDKAIERREIAYNKTLESGRMVEDNFEINVVDWQKSCKDEGVLPSYPTLKDYQLYIERRFSEENNKKISLKFIRKREKL